MTPDQIALTVLGGLVVLVIVGALLFVRTGRKNTDAGSSTSAGALTSRGWSGPGGGMSNYLQPPAEWRGTTVQVCGLWPYSIGPRRAQIYRSLDPAEAFAPGNLTLSGASSML